MRSSPTDDSTTVLFYESQFYMFSNFSSFTVEIDGRVWMTAEHAYQAAKFAGVPNGDVIQKMIFEARSAHDAKKIARAHNEKRRPDWNNIKLDVMERILRAKLSQHEYVRTMLLKTGERHIAENSPVDSFWGIGHDGQGENHLGKIWMKLRDELARIVVTHKPADPLKFWYECTCPCHEMNSKGEIIMEHVMPCCQGQCGWCEMYIVGSMEGHIEEMHPDQVGKPMPSPIGDIGDMFKIH